MRRKPLDRAYFFDNAIVQCFGTVTHSPEGMHMFFTPYPIGIDSIDHNLNPVNC